MATAPPAREGVLARYEPVIGLEVHCQLLTAHQDLLRLPEPLRRRAQHQRLPGVPRPARAPCRCSTRQAVTLALRAALATRLHRAADVGLRAQELLLSRPAQGLPDLAVRPAAGRPSGARRDPGRAAASARVRAAPHPHGGGRGQAPARGLPLVGGEERRRLQPQRRARSSRSSPSPTCAAPRRRTPTSPRCAPSCSTPASPTATWRRARCAATPTSPCGRAGAEALGTRAEIKNLNSFRNVARAIEHEIARQVGARCDVGRAASCRRRACGTPTAARRRPMRSKEEAHDYRYFPEPDLPPLVVDRGVARGGARARCPSCPREKRRRFVAEYGLPDYDAGVLTLSPRGGGLLRGGGAGQRQRQGRLQLGDDRGAAQAEGRRRPLRGRARSPPPHLAELIRLIDARHHQRQDRQGRVRDDVDDAARRPRAIVEREGLTQVSDEGALAARRRGGAGREPGAGGDLPRAARPATLGWFVGQVMRKTGGKANPQLVQRAAEEGASTEP